MSTNMQCRIDDLPDELLEYILSLIPPYKDLRQCKLVSKRWCRAIRNVIEHNEAHFRKAVSFGALFWSLWTKEHWMPTINKRHSHSACTYENSMYVFGGCTSTCTTFNDLWRLDLDTRTWVRPITLGSYPSPKASATMLYYKKSFILFGGWSHPSRFPLHQQWKLFNELHVYSIEKNRWNVINTLETPPPMSAHSASIHGNNMIVFGGILRGFRNSSDVWCLNLDTYSWHKPAISIVKPQPRYGQSQIHLGDNHILVLGGCTGPNAAMNDAWLLHMTQPTWKWKKVKLYHPEWAPARIWCHQACKVGNYIVVLSNNKRHAKVSDMSIGMKNVTCQRPARLPDITPLQESKQRQKPDIDTDENVNGKHGFFSRSPSQSARPSLWRSNFTKPVPLCGDSALSMAAFRDEPLSNSSSINRQRQLESLRRMEEKLRSRKAQTKVVKRTENTLSIFILDISKVLDESSASWIPLKQNDQSGPNERILYSLVMGRGELIVFGGIRKEQTTIQGHPEVDESEIYNDLHFINPPKYVI